MLWEIKPLERAKELRDVWDFFHWLDQLALRWFQGHMRYGLPDRKKRYMRRLELELDAYKASGNKEHLANIAVYAYLEAKAPQNKLSHWDPLIDSVTRGTL